jgi:hypothetical protein
MKKICLASLLGALLGACGGGGGSDIAVENLGTEYARAACAKAYACCSTAELTAMGMTGDEAACRSQMGVFMSLMSASIADSVSEGRVDYSGSGAGCMVDYVDGLSCADYSTMSTGAMPSDVPDCDAMLTPKVAKGGACTQSYECTTDYCKGATSTADGACDDLPGVGAECTDECAEGYYCDTSGTTNVCAAKKANGADCTDDDECTSGTCATTCTTPAPTCDGA